MSQIQPCNLRTKEGKNRGGEQRFHFVQEKTPTTTATAQSRVRPRPDDMNHVKRRAPSCLGVKVSCSCALEFDTREPLLKIGDGTLLCIGFRSGLRFKTLRVWVEKPQGKSIFKDPTGSKKKPANSPRYFADFIAEHDGKEEVSTRTLSVRPAARRRPRVRPSRRSVSSTVTDERRGRRD